ncbi:unnamed protein product [Chondrus crispus]|uniref:Uncharacterized protein n=1 Tax=Chondrus crispus TaxID=2769 RepID=R7QCW2_CHOCR|nr:unnamed protein product [Chondrus crispus]CDF35603.1 unnamed protein product [Chondrus crispus]|eukprot:XP_005715422.1 unnamed protein product [Chondrus crispus]
MIMRGRRGLGSPSRVFRGFRKRSHVGKDLKACKRKAERRVVVSGCKKRFHGKWDVCLRWW